MNLTSFRSLPFVAFAFVFGAATSAGCANDAGDDVSAQGTTNDELRARKTDDAIKADLEAAVAKLYFMSESDYPFTIVSAPINSGERITTGFVKRHFDTLAGTGDDIRTLSLSKMASEIRTFDGWFESFAVNVDEPLDEELVAYFGEMKKVKTALAKDIRDLRVYRFGHKMRGGGVEGQVNIFIVGRSPSGTMMGVFTKSVET